VPGGIEGETGKPDSLERCRGCAAKTRGGPASPLRLVLVGVGSYGKRRKKSPKLFDRDAVLGVVVP